MPNNVVVKVYVRKDGYGNTPNRTMSFDRPSGVTDAMALEHGYAIDGTALVISSKVGDLQPKQQALVEWLGELKYEVEFT